MRSKKGLTPREKDFCLRFANSLDAEQSARLAGYRKEPFKKAGALLLREDVISEITRISHTFEALSSSAARRGLEKLALGGISDAVSLLYLKNPDKSVLEKMDLSCVSEIKAKDDLVEIKFFDRLKALEKLCTYSEASLENESGSPVYNAILQGARALRQKKEGEPCED